MQVSSRSVGDGEGKDGQMMQGVWIIAEGEMVTLGALAWRICTLLEQGNIRETDEAGKQERR